MRDGLETVFSSYQIEAMLYLINHPTQGYTTKEIHNAVLKALAPETISRASIINFLAEIAELGFLTYTIESCKGGFRRRYRSVYDNLKAFKNSLGNNIIMDVQRELLDL